MKILKDGRKGKKVNFSSEEAFIAFTKEGILTEVPRKLLSGDGSEESEEELASWIKNNNKFLNDFIDTLNFLNGEADNYDSSHLDEDIEKRELPPDYIVSQDIFVNAELGSSVEIKDSDIHGVGLFASKNIQEGEFIHYTHVYHHTLKGWAALQPNYKYNHSFKDNCEVVEGNRCMKLIAIKAIKKGEELLANYADNDKLEQPAPEWY
tara:strand:+ start:1381 stop:2004 length:624 start_codon:yes stop_codon:yes gene_type:complete